MERFTMNDTSLLRFKTVITIFVIIFSISISGLTYIFEKEIEKQKQRISEMETVFLMTRETLHKQAEEINILKRLYVSNEERFHKLENK